MDTETYPKNTLVKSNGQPQNDVRFYEIKVILRKRKPRIGTTLIVYGHGLNQAMLINVIKRKLKKRG